MNNYNEDDCSNDEVLMEDFSPWVVFLCLIIATVLYPFIRLYEIVKGEKL